MSIKKQHSKHNKALP